jgi:RNase P subunit RPR2
MRSDFGIRNGELFQRMDYLLRLSNELYDKHPNMAKGYTKMMKDVSKRNALRMDPKFKRLVCKCSNLLFKDKNTDIKLESIYISLI